jgi:drug/metabolite transporter (DMT)-like permease
MFPAFLTTILFSISAVCAQRTSRTLGGVEANFWRLLLATALLGLWAHIAGNGISGKAFPFFLLSGFLGFGIGDMALYQALPKLGSRLSILLVHCIAAPVAAATEWFWLGTPMSGPQIAGAALILSGVALALAPGRHLQISRRDFWIGTALGVFAAVGQGIGVVVSRHGYRVAERAGEPITGLGGGLTAAYQRILAGIVVAAGFFLWLKFRAKKGDAKTPLVRQFGFLPLKSLWPWILANGTTGPALGVGCYQWALTLLGTGVVLPIVALTPLVIIPFSRYVEGERPRKRSLAGGLVAVAGVFILLGGLNVVKKFISSGVGFP